MDGSSAVALDLQDNNPDCCGFNLLEHPVKNGMTRLIENFLNNLDFEVGNVLVNV